MTNMRKRDILTPISITLGFIMIIMAILSNLGKTGLASFFNVVSIFIVIGGLFASLLINFKKEQLKLGSKVIPLDNPSNNLNQYKLAEKTPLDFNRDKNDSLGELMESVKAYLDENDLNSVISANRTGNCLMLDQAVLFSF